MTGKRKKVFVVDHSAINLAACKSILRPFYDVYTAQSAVKLLELLE